MCDKCKSFSEFREGIEPELGDFWELDSESQGAMVAEMLNVLTEGVDDSDSILSEAMLTREQMLQQVQRLDPKRAQRGDNTRPINIESVSLKGNQGSTNGVRVVFKVPTQTGTVNEEGAPRRYLTFIDILDLQNHIFDNGQDLKKFMEFLKTAKIRVYCSCPDFFWNGAKFNLGIHSDDNSLKDSLVRDKKYGYKGKNRETGEEYEEEYDVKKAPDIRDPDRKHILCKHLYACLKYLPNNAQVILSKASKLMGIMLNQDPNALRKDGEKTPDAIKTTIVKPTVAKKPLQATQEPAEGEESTSSIKKPVIAKKPQEEPETANEEPKQDIDVNKALIGIQKPKVSRKQEKREQRAQQNTSSIVKPIIKNKDEEATP